MFYCDPLYSSSRYYNHCKLFGSYLIRVEYVSLDIELNSKKTSEREQRPEQSLDSGVNWNWPIRQELMVDRHIRLPSSQGMGSCAKHKGSTE